MLDDDVRKMATNPEAATNGAQRRWSTRVRYGRSKGAEGVVAGTEASDLDARARSA